MAEAPTWYFVLYVGWTLDFIHPVWSAPSQPHSGFVHQRLVGSLGRGQPEHAAGARVGTGRDLSYHFQRVEVDHRHAVVPP